MAKLINGLLGNSTNKVGNLVTYVAKGQQIARSKAANIANPRTAAQMEQRTKLANMVSFYRVSKGWMEKLAFESKPNTQSVYNAFVKANSGEVAVHLTKQLAAQKACVVAPYLLTQGSLWPVSLTFSDNNAVSDLVIGLQEFTTIGAFSKALVDGNPNVVREGMQLSICVYQQQTLNDVPVARCAYDQIIIDSNNNSAMDTLNLAALFSIVNGSFAINTSDLGNVPCGVALVLSETVNGKTFVSSQTLVLSSTSVYEQYQDAAAAGKSYGSTAVPFLDSNE